jgi:hypothetical protein
MTAGRRSDSQEKNAARNASEWGTSLMAIHAVEAARRGDTSLRCDTRAFTPGLSAAASHI